MDFCGVLARLPLGRLRVFWLAVFVDVVPNNVFWLVFQAPNLVSQLADFFLFRILGLSPRFVGSSPVIDIPMRVSS